MEILIRQLISSLKKIDQRMERTERRLSNIENALGSDRYGGPIPEREMSYYDELLEKAVHLVLELGVASASTLQKRMKIGYARAARLLDIMTHKGIIGPPRGAKPREILINDINDLDESWQTSQE